MIHYGNLTITAENAGDFAELTEVKGWLDINTPINLPKLQSVGGGLYIYADAKLPKLQSVGGGLYIYADAKLPKLQTVGDWLEIHADVTLPTITHIHGKRMLTPYVVDSRGYAGALVEGNLIAAGCRLFSFAQARKHWGKREDTDAKFWLDKTKEWEGI